VIVLTDCDEDAGQTDDDERRTEQQRKVKHLT